MKRFSIQCSRDQGGHETLRGGAPSINAVERSAAGPV
jgi:hypothetical protein